MLCVGEDIIHKYSEAFFSVLFAVLRDEVYRVIEALREEMIYQNVTQVVVARAILDRTQGIIQQILSQPYYAGHQKHILTISRFLQKPLQQRIEAYNKAKNWTPGGASQKDDLVIYHSNESGVNLQPVGIVHVAPEASFVTPSPPGAATFLRARHSDGDLFAHMSRRKPRTTITAEAKARMEEVFTQHEYIMAPERIALANELQLDESVIKVFWQNKRAAIKLAKRKNILDDR